MIALLRTANNKRACRFAVHQNKNKERRVHVHTSRIGVVNCDTKVLQRTRVMGRSKGKGQSQNGNSNEVRNTFHRV